MSSQRFSPEFKKEAVRQIVDRRYSVAEVSERLAVSAHSLYKWVKTVKSATYSRFGGVAAKSRSSVFGSIALSGRPP